VRGYYSTADVLDVDHYNIDGTDRALVLGVRELDQSALNSDVQNWLNLHTVYTHGNDVIAAFANQRNESNQEQVLGDTDKTQWAEGNQIGQDALAKAVGTYEDRVYFGEKSPDYSVVGRAGDAPNRELNLSRATSTDTTDEGDDDTSSESTTTYSGDGGVSVGSTFRRLLYAIKFGSTNFLLSSRLNENSEVIYNRDPKDRVQKVAPWLTLDDDAYPAIVDGKILWIVDGYTTTDRFPGSERESFKTMTDDTLQDETGLRTLPTDEINYMRNSVKATVDAYDGTVTLYEWDDQDPILKAWSAAFPGTVKPKADIPPSLEEHLRYPEDLFKVQRYQFARYHVTDPQAWFQDNNRWEVPEDPNGAKAYQPPYRMFVTQPTGLIPSGDNPEDVPAVPEGQVWSMTSTFVPYKRLNLAAYVSVDSDATSDTYGQIRVIDVIDEQQQGPSQVANSMQSDPTVSERLAEFNRSGNSLTYGNLLTVPLGDELMYVEPVYARRATNSEANFPILRYVLVSYKGGVGLDTTLQGALEIAISNVDEPGDDGTTDPGTPTPTPTPTDDPTDDPTSSSTADPGSVEDLLAQAQEEFQLADEALTANDLAEYQEHIQKARELVQQALALEGGGASSSPSPSPKPSGATPTP